MKLWDKGTQADKTIEKFTTGDDYIRDKELLPYDCRGTAAHVKMLAQQGFLTKTECKNLLSELEVIKSEALEGKIEIPIEMEDCHTYIENRLSEKFNEAGKKTHTGRSRNDQVLTALRLYAKDKLSLIQKQIQNLIDSLKRFSRQHAEQIFPGYTHTRKAMPSNVGAWAEAFANSLEDELLLYSAALKLFDQSPLGTGAGYGVPLALDRDMTAKEMRFSRVQKSAVYSQMSRGKFELFAVNCMVQTLMTLNRFASDVILFSLPELGYFKLPEKVCTGSSIMPQKQNPDLLELVRAKLHIVTGFESQIRGICSNLITGYHRDSQLTKAPFMDSLETTLQCLEIVDITVKEMKVDSEMCEKGLTNEIWATHKACELVKQGVPFRDAYKQIAKEFTASSNDKKIQKH